jgi:hypothetical protein
MPFGVDCTALRHHPILYSNDRDSGRDSNPLWAIHRLILLLPMLPLLQVQMLLLQLRRQAAPQQADA